MKEFSDWLRNEIRDRDWSQADLAEKSSVPGATISRIINDTRDPGPDVCNKFAKALNYPPEFVFRKAGILPENKETATSPTLEEANRLMQQIPEEYQKQALALIRFLHETHASYDAEEPKSTPN